MNDNRSGEIPERLVGDLTDRIGGILGIFPEVVMPDPLFQQESTTRSIDELSEEEITAIVDQDLDTDPLTKRSVKPLNFKPSTTAILKSSTDFRDRPEVPIEFLPPISPPIPPGVVINPTIGSLSTGILAGDQISVEGAISYHMEQILCALERTTELRPGLQETPMRVAKMLLEITSGQRSKISPEQLLGKTFQDPELSRYRGMVVIDNIPFRSTCEHHLAQFSGRVHIGYIPAVGQVLGLSKFPRLVELYALRLQVQERMTFQIARDLEQYVAGGVIVVVQAEHTCMTERGVKAHGSTTTTVELRGAFEEHAVRDEFYSILGLRSRKD